MSVGPEARALTKAITPWPEETSDPKELLGAGLTAENAASRFGTDR